jgi:DNA-binding NtrC family response regulator
MSKPVSLPKLVDVLEKSLRNGDPVLVVDDDPEFLRSIGDPLRARGFAILEASSLDQALEIISEKSPVAAVLDLRISDFPLESVLAFKRASPAVALILCSGDHGLVDLTAAQAPRGAVYASVRKPFSPDQLIELLDDIVQRS